MPPGLRMMFGLKGDLAKQPGEARNLGSIVAELAMVATGGFQYAVFGAPKLWDVAAGALIVREAGGVALTWEAGRWRRIDRFRRPPHRRGKKPSTLRDWVQPVLVAGPGAARHVGSRLAPHPRPIRAVRWYLQQRKAVRDWWKKRRGGTSEQKPPSPAAPHSEGAAPAPPATS